MAAPKATFLTPASIVGIAAMTRAYCIGAKFSQVRQIRAKCRPSSPEEPPLST
jgi:hypothetical protein